MTQIRTCDFIKTKILTKFQVGWAKNVATKVSTTKMLMIDNGWPQNLSLSKLCLAELKIQTGQNFKGLQKTTLAKMENLVFYSIQNIVEKGKNAGI